MMADSPLSFEFRSNVLNQLRRRNEKESECFSEIVSLSHALYDSLDLLQKENLKLKIQNAKLDQENIDLQVHGESGSFKPSEKTSLLEKKVYQLQEELTELHRKKGEYAQQVIDLRNSLDEKDKELVTKTARLQESEAACKALEATCEDFRHKISELELKFQLVKDEYDALLITYASMEEKKQKLEQEHQELISRWMAMKTRDIERLNAETERIQRLKQVQLQKELEEAAREPVALDSSRINDSKIPRVSSGRWPVSIDKVRKLIGVYNSPQATESQSPNCGKRMKNAAICIEASVPRRMLYQFDAHEGEVNAIIWAPSGDSVVTGGGDRKVKLWEVTHTQATLKGTAVESNSSVMSVDFDSEESYILGASCDFASRVWNVNDLKIRHTLTGHSGKVMAAKFLSESSRVVSGSHDRTLKIWDLKRRACVRTIFAGSSCNDIVTSDESASTIVSGHFDKKIRFWDQRSESSANEILLQGKITSLDLCAVDGYSLLCCVRDDTLKLLDFRMNQVVKTFSSEGFVVGCDWTRAKFSPDGQYCVAGSQDGSIYIWVISTGKVEKVLKQHKATVTVCAWSPNGSYLISCDKNKKAILWSDF